MFGFGKKKPAPPPPASRRSAAAQASNQRGAYRAQIEFPVFYELLNRPGERRAFANDLSGGGLRLLNDEDMVREQECMLRFTLPSDFLEEFKEYKEVEEITPFGARKKRVPKPPPRFEEMRVRAKSLIIFFNLQRKLFIHGMQFVGISEQMSDEIQRFNHYWQLYEIRLKRGGR
ncbi:MAG: hypothetical protein JO101_11220 [Candidatus Eremiobacteraeota bacterium]|nr:hypothetical protein [Candidatus Eremiobacteraeota bacterium]MBV8355883.1 hypothetical protein [Candidatus Eremiobacteraeota bacterium]